MVTNRFSPLLSGASPYNLSDVPARWASNSALSPEQLTKKLAYEWLNSHEIGGSDSNPPFTSGAAGRINPILDGQRITRGYIRRAQYEKNDATSKARLYFMFNPETIVRDYVSYLDQAALDPFNTVYGSNNLVAPPSFMNFRFDLFFDRQDEVASNMDNPGVFADYQFFDLVVRNVIPTDPNSMSTTIPDNGVMMVNPRDITVVFSPQLTVQGRPVNAQVIFEKFSHRMTPIRMRISLEMRVVYIGPMRPMSEYTMETYAAATTNTVTNDDSLDASFTYTELVIADGAANGATGYQPGVNLTVGSGLGSLLGLSDSPNMNVRIAALQWAREHVRPGYTEYNNSTTLRARGVDPSGAFKYVDCSALVWYAYNAIGMTSKMRWGGSTSSPSNTSNMIDAFSRGGIQTLIRWTPADKAQVSLFFKEPSNRSKIQAGDLLLRNKSVVTSKDTGHVAFILGWTPGGDLVVFDAAGPTADPPVGERVISRAKLVDNYSDIVRPVPLGSTSYSSAIFPNTYVGTSYVDPVTGRK